MTQQPAASISEHFEGVQDPRVACLVTHPLVNIMTITLCAVIARADNWSEVATFGEGKQAWLARFLDLSQGTPSHDTFSHGFARLDPKQLHAGFISWVQAIHRRLTGKVVAVRIYCLGYLNAINHANGGTHADRILAGEANGTQYAAYCQPGQNTTLIFAISPTGETARRFLGLAAAD